jgi:putative membrane protein
MGMNEQAGNKGSSKVRNRRVHMANERTFLAWVRTSIGIMAFGFVVERFALFMKQFSLLLGNAGVAVAQSSGPRGYASIFGIILVALGALIGLLSFVRYKKVERQIDEDTYQPSLILNVLLALSVLSIGFFLIVYLLHISA